MSSTDQSENDFLSKYCATESDICESVGIQRPQYTDLELAILRSKKKSFHFICQQSPWIPRFNTQNGKFMLVYMWGMPYRSILVLITSVASKKLFLISAKK